MTLGQQNIYQRLASFILEFMRVPTLFDERRSYLYIPVNRFDLADYLGMAPETTARAFNRLESEGLVRRIDSRMIEILNVNGLKNLRSRRRRNPDQAVSRQKLSPLFEQQTSTTRQIAEPRTPHSNDAAVIPFGS
jgi:hypothetical protein